MVFARWLHSSYTKLSCYKMARVWSEFSLRGKETFNRMGNKLSICLLSNPRNSSNEVQSIVDINATWHRPQKATDCTTERTRKKKMKPRNGITKLESDLGIKCFRECNNGLDLWIMKHVSAAVVERWSNKRAVFTVPPLLFNLIYYYRKLKTNMFTTWLW